MDVAAAEAAKVVSVVEVRLSEATSGMTVGK